MWLHCPVWNESDITVAQIEHKILLLQLWFSQGPPSATLWTFIGEWFFQIVVCASAIEMSRKKELDMLRSIWVWQPSRLQGFSKCFTAFSWTCIFQSHTGGQTPKLSTAGKLTRFFCRKTCGIQPIRCLSWDRSWAGSLSHTFSSGWDWQHCCSAVIGRVHFSVFPKSISISQCRDLSWFVNMERVYKLGYSEKWFLCLPSLAWGEFIYISTYLAFLASWCFCLTLNDPALSFITSVLCFKVMDTGKWWISVSTSLLFCYLVHFPIKPV